uniref:Translation initiation factor 2, beta subunit n=1 Tax=Pithovirus LCPAC304 TaxID=2506594 RepID=A0A481Z8X1_9VIRU|nr:MAG: translation initiation factor 2, beta subunit [Pithovirus LCPAC304]
MYAVGPHKIPQKRTLQFGEPTSRYQTVQLQLCYVGRNKMMRTGFSNITRVAKKMMVPKAYIVAFLGYRLKTKVFHKEGKVWLAGRYEPNTISNLLIEFIKMMVLCTVCTKPELELLVHRNKTGTKCRACGACTQKTYTPEKFQKYVVTHAHLLPAPSSKKRRRKIERSPKKGADKTFSVDTSDTAVEERRKAASLPSIFQTSSSNEEIDIDELIDDL